MFRKESIDQRRKLSALATSVTILNESADLLPVDVRLFCMSAPVLQLYINRSIYNVFWKYICLFEMKAVKIQKKKRFKKLPGSDFQTFFTRLAPTTTSSSTDSSHPLYQFANHIIHIPPTGT